MAPADPGRLRRPPPFSTSALRKFVFSYVLLKLILFLLIAILRNLCTGPPEYSLELSVVLSHSKHGDSLVIPLTTISISNPLSFLPPPQSIVSESLQSRGRRPAPI